MGYKVAKTISEMLAARANLKPSEITELLRKDGSTVVLRSFSLSQGVDSKACWDKQAYSGVKVSMNQIDAIIYNLKKYNLTMGLADLWFACNSDAVKEDHPNISIEYDPEAAFFKALLVLLESGDWCLFYTLNSQEPSLDGEHLTGSPQEQITLLKQAWVGKAEMDKMDEENGYLGWYFLIHCPYSLAHKIYDESGYFLKWCHAE